MRSLPKIALVITLATVISTLGIMASDELTGVDGRFSGSLGNADEVCEPNSSLFLLGDYSVCIDKYEASPGSKCIFATPESNQETKANISEASCKAVSVPNVKPWSFVSYTNAAQLCARSGKRLIKNDEWYKIALGSQNVNTCFPTSQNQPSKTGINNCVSAAGVYDVVGNLWEWMDEVATDGKFADKDLPESGYVTSVDERGIVRATGEEPDSSFGADYAWLNKEGTKGILRGGFYGSKDDGGIFSQNITMSLDFSSAGVGFRCVKDI